MPKTKREKDLEQQLHNANEALEMALALSPETDNNFFTGGMSGMYQGVNTWDRQKVFSEALRAWRINPIARRIVRLLRSFILGKGIEIKSEDQSTQKELSAWWHNPLNNLDKNIPRWKDEESRTGNLFLLCTIGESDNLYVRAIPSEAIEEINSLENDVEQETSYKISDNYKLGQEEFPSYANRNAENKFIIHYASNQPVGSAWGESDLAPLLVWIGRFSSWLEDRVRLNHFRTIFNYVVQIQDESKRKSREAEINANPPKPGRVLVTTPAEQWGVISANLDSFDASVDGMAIKRNILSGLGFPMHWFAEPEGSTRTTAEAAGTPTFRTLEESQAEFFSWIEQLATIALEIKTGTSNSEIWVEGPDITERDNATLALAFARAYPALAEHYDREGIDAKEFNRLLYKFLAEVTDEDNTPDIKRKPLVQPIATPTDKSDSKTDESDTKDDPSLSQQLFNQEILSALHNKEPQSIHVNIPASVTNVSVPETIIHNNIQPQKIDIHVPEQEAPIVNLTSEKPNITVRVNPTPVIVKPSLAQVKIENKVEIPEHDETLVVERNAEGQATKIEKKYRKSEK